MDDVVEYVEKNIETFHLKRLQSLEKLKYCGQKFWSFISENDNLYIDIIEPLGHKARERNNEFQKAYNKLLNRFVKEFSNEYCKSSGEIDWEKIVKLNSECALLLCGNYE
jgi:hypothetical protein